MNPFRKYFYVFVLFWQEGMAQRATFFMERFRAVVMMVSFYYLWTALLANRSSFAGYDRSQIITYTLGMNLLRSIVFTSKTEMIPQEINHGRLSAYLLRPVNFIGFTFMRDLSEKSVQIVSSVIEIAGVILLFHMSVRWPEHAITWALFGLSAVGALAIFFAITFMVGCWGFWTSEAWGPRFLVELTLEFTAGAFFPIDILSPALQRFLHVLPSPYLVFFPLNIFLEKVTPTQMAEGFVCQWLWVGVASALAFATWRRGLYVYAAQGG